MPGETKADVRNGTWFGLSRGEISVWTVRLFVLVAVLWTANNYVSKADYKRDIEVQAAATKELNKTLSEIVLTLARIDERSKTDDSKQRITELEKGFHDLDKRLPRP